MTQRIGITLGLEGARLSDQLRLARHALEVGYTDIWTAEVGGGDGFSPLAAAATLDGSPRLGTGIVPVASRPPALLAMSAATIQNLSRGRFVLGLGTSSNIIVENWMGESFARPVSRLKETVEVLREILSGKKVSYEGESFRLKDFRLQIDPTAPIPIYLAALGPRACRLAGELADGVIFFLKSPDGVRQALEWVAEGARAAGRDPDELDCVMRVTAAIDEDESVLKLIMRRLITTYAMVDVYNRSLALQGFSDEAAAIVDAWRAGERERAAESVSDAMIDQLIVAGDGAAARNRLQAFRDAGVKTPVLLPLSVTPDPDDRARRVAETISAAYSGTDAGE